MRSAVSASISCKGVGERSAVNILHLNSSISSRSGVMRVLMNYHNEIVNMNTENVRIDYCYYAASPDSYEDQIRNLGSSLRKISNPLNLYHFRRDLAEILVDYDIVHLHDPNLARLVYPTVKRMKSCQLIVHSHATAYSDKKLSAIRNRLLCANLPKYADALFACSDAAGRFLFGKSPYCLIRNAIPVSDYAFNEIRRWSIRQQLGIEANCLVIGHVGNFVKQKNHAFLIEAFEAMQRLEPNSRLLLVGNGPLMSMTREQIRGRGLENSVSILGARNDVADLYQAMDVFILTSLYEGLPMVGVEAQAAGLPVLFSSRVTREVEIAPSLFLDLEKGPEAWAHALIDLAKLQRKSAQQTMDLFRSKGFDIKAEFPKLIEAYRFILSR